MLWKSDDWINNLFTSFRATILAMAVVDIPANNHKLILKLRTSSTKLTKIEVEKLTRKNFKLHLSMAKAKISQIKHAL